MRAKCVNEHDNQFELLLKAKKWNEAHAVLVEFLAPDMLLKRKKILSPKRFSVKFYLKILFFLN